METYPHSIRENHAGNVKFARIYPHVIELKIGVPATLTTIFHMHIYTYALKLPLLYKFDVFELKVCK